MIVEAETRYVVHIKGTYESVHYNSRDQILSVDGYYANTQSAYGDTTFSNKILSAKTWKRKKDADNRLNDLISIDKNKRKNLTGEVIEVTLSITYDINKNNDCVVRSFCDFQ